MSDDEAPEKMTAAPSGSNDKQDKAPKQSVERFSPAAMPSVYAPPTWGHMYVVPPPPPSYPNVYYPSPAPGSVVYPPPAQDPPPAQADPTPYNNDAGAGCAVNPPAQGPPPAQAEPTACNNLAGDLKVPSEASDADAEHNEGIQEDGSEDGVEDQSSSSKLKIYVRSKLPAAQERLDRRARSRAREAVKRQRIQNIRNKLPSERSAEEQEFLRKYEASRERKNNRSQQRSAEKNAEVERILNKPENERTKLEIDFLKVTLTARKRKNMNDRLRRQGLKQSKKPASPVEKSLQPQAKSVPPQASLPTVPYTGFPMTPTNVQAANNVIHPTVTPLDAAFKPVRTTQDKESTSKSLAVQKGKSLQADDGETDSHPVVGV